MSVFSNQRVINFIRDNFIPCTTDINKSVHRRDEVGDFFRKIAEQGHYAGRTKPTSTRQGLYVTTADGNLLASVNSTRAKDVLQMMNRAAFKFKDLENKNRPEISDEFEADKMFAIPFPEGGMILRITCRDLPRPSNALHKTRNHNFDNAWLTADEVKSFAPLHGDGDIKSGLAYDIPSAVIARIAKFHLIDHVKGEAPWWKPSSVKEANASARVVRVKEGRAFIKLSGHVKCDEAPDKKIVNPYSGARNRRQGIDLQLSGRLVWDIKQEKFTQFQWVAIGDRWGTATYNFRHNDLQKNPIGFLLELLPTTPENMTEPKYLIQGYFE